MMPRSLFVPFLAAVFLVAPLSGSALAQKTPTTDAINLNSSRSNVDRMGGGGGVNKKQGKTKPSNPNGGPAGTERMGGGGGRSKPKSKALNPQPEPPG
jgi:hypothetical protein